MDGELDRGAGTDRKVLRRTGGDDRRRASAGRRRVVRGEGRERAALERMASENVVFTGRADDATLRSLLASARGLIFPAEDDFGIVCAEALASGAPVVALAAGGIFDIVRDG